MTDDAALTPQDLLPKLRAGCSSHPGGTILRLAIAPSLLTRTDQVLEQLGHYTAVRAILCETMVALLLVGLLSGCSVSPEWQEALHRAWAEGEAERAQDCQRHGLRYTAGVCTGGGGGP